MIRRMFRTMLSVLVALVTGHSSCGAEPEARRDPGRPNFVVMLCDDLGYGDLGCYGNEVIRTPNLDRLAGEGVRLTACYAAAPVCSPSRVGLLTGRIPDRTGVIDWIPDNSGMHLPAGETTVATLLRRAGYETGHVGKWHCNGKFNSPEQPQPPDHGFTYWFSTQNNARPSHRNPVNFVRNGEPVGEIPGYSCQIVADEAIGWMTDKRDMDRPFFLFVCFHEPHEPVASPPELEAMYPGADKKGQAAYYANVTNMDQAAGRIVKAIDDLGLAEETLVLFTSDNGPETLNRYRGAWRSHGSPGPLRGMKLHMYEGGIRVPGIIRWTGRVAGGRTDGQAISGVDVLPTLCELAGMDVPGSLHIDGSSFAPLLDGRAITRRAPLYWSYERAISKPKIAMRLDGWKILADWSEAGDGGRPRALVDFELFRIDTDIGEQQDLSAVESDVLENLERQLVEMARSVHVGAPLGD
jgi:arylsulfatase A